MKHKQLVSHFLAYLAARPPQPEDAKEPLAMLYGTDEVKVNFKREAIRFENREWISVPGLSQHCGRLEWLAVIPEEEGARIVFGEGPPFCSQAAEHLPTRNGRILAAPASIVAAMSRPRSPAPQEGPPEIATTQVPELEVRPNSGPAFPAADPVEVAPGPQEPQGQEGHAHAAEADAVHGDPVNSAETPEAAVVPLESPAMEIARNAELSEELQPEPAAALEESQPEVAAAESEQRAEPDLEPATGLAAQTAQPVEPAWQEPAVAPQVDHTAEEPQPAEPQASSEPEPAVDAHAEPTRELAAELEAEPKPEPEPEAEAEAEAEAEEVPEPEAETTPRVPPVVCEADPLLRRGRLPLFLLAQLRKLKVGEVLILVNVKGPGQDPSDDTKGRALALVEKIGADSYAMRALWTLQVGRTPAACPHILSEAVFTVLNSRRLEIEDLGKLQEVLKVLRRCDYLSRVAKRAGDRESYSQLSPQLFEAHTRNAAIAPQVRYLDRLRVPG